MPGTSAAWSCATDVVEEVRGSTITWFAQVSYNRSTVVKSIAYSAWSMQASMRIAAAG
jgi:flavin reductase (DIM6/NTAB) family NADH-FMN oxidoreductase RutF